jgi:hypothetical protein
MCWDFTSICSCVDSRASSHQPAATMDLSCGGNYPPCSTSSQTPALCCRLLQVTCELCNEQFQFSEAEVMQYV